MKKKRTRKKKYPSESDLEKWLLKEKNLLKIEKGLKFIDNQVDLGDFGRLDVLCRDSSGRHVIIELKRPDEIVDETIVSQVFKYRTGLMEKREYRIKRPTKVRILCFVNKITPRARKICEQAGIGIATYDLREISFPEKTVGALPETELKHGVFPVRRKFFKKLDKYCFYDVNQPVKWIKPSSVIVFCSDKRLMAEAEVIQIEREYKTNKKLNEFLSKIGYLTQPSSTLLNTVIIHEGLVKYNPPVWWDSYLQKFQPHKHFYPEQPMAIDEIELTWIRGQ